MVHVCLIAACVAASSLGLLFAHRTRTLIFSDDSACADGADGAEGLGGADDDDEAEMLGPDDSISNAGQQSPHAMATPRLPWVRLVASRGGPAANEDGGLLGTGDNGGGGGVKVAQPRSVADLLDHATRKAALLWPSRPASVATALLDADGCEVDEDNFCLVQPGDILYVKGTGPDGAASPLPTSPASSSAMLPARVGSAQYIG